MILMLDLDRTLIFSTRFVAENESSVEKVPAELRRTEICSWCAAGLREGLLALRKRGVTLVANTSRSVDEFKSVFMYDIFDYAVVANGGLVLHNGILDKRLTELAKSDVYSYGLNRLERDLRNLKSLTHVARIVDGSYVFVKLDVDKAVEFAKDFLELQHFYPDFDFVCVKTKLYCLPKGLSKHNITGHLMADLNDYYLIAAGDTVLDVNMLISSDVSIAGSHSEIVMNGLLKPAHVVSAGLPGTLELLDIVNAKLDELNGEMDKSM